MDRHMLIHTLGVVARARGMMKLSKDTGITRAGLYKALSPDGNPSFETVAKIVGGAFGMRLSAQRPDVALGRSCCQLRGKSSACACRVLLEKPALDAESNRQKCDGPIAGLIQTLSRAAASPGHRLSAADSRQIQRI
jgi:probable addiction module antidote protein